VIRLWRFLFVRYRSLTLLVFLFVFSLSFAMADGFWLMARLANVILLAIPVAFVWARLNLAGVEVEVTRPRDRVQVGAPYEERITVINRSWFGKLWLEIEDQSELPGFVARRVVSVRPRSRRTWRVAAVCTRRGVYRVGPVRVTTSDPFGLFHPSRTFGERQRVLVYPRAAELPNFWVPPALLPGEGRFRRPAHAVTPNAAGVRPYAPGDSLNRIHWRTTARTGELMVKLFELDPTSDVWIVLDLHGPVQAGSGDWGTEEYGIQVAASVARYFLLANRSVGFLASGRQFHEREPDRGIAQYTRILEELALARAEGEVPLSSLLTYEGRRFGRNTTVVVVTPSTDESWVEALGTLAGRGAKLAVVLLEPRTFGGEGNALLTYGTLTALGIYTYLLKRGDDLSTALSEGAPRQEVRG
jgi:uncharacterized protein (DUF58 family)